ncbi:UHRF1-binding protein 1 [Polypterus senegalus]|uniref:UHRF1-binding protein 1 n=1 Tax=Polypterus senegalus TaxID=55291 RepID=UPI001965A4FE|nr:UHRF1-binding protein 1 [Polypterus senegalus]
MAGIIKKQILKHLSRFTKNLSPDKINLSTLKGEGQLSNLELDEEVLQNMLDLPTWLAVTRVYCNKAAIRIQWTKLKTSPICLFLDKVEVEMRTCEEPRPPNGPSPIAITAGQSEYGFAEKVVEGMSVVINSITIKVQAKAFHASFELWQLHGCSLNPKWQQSDLRLTRITDPRRGEVLTFKEINWQTLRIEADAIESEEHELASTPLRLITNQGRLRIALKRRVKDCNVVASKLMFILDDLLWVLTDLQLKAMIRYAKSLSEAIERSAQQQKSLDPESLQAPPTSPGGQPPWAKPAQPAQPSGTPNSISQYFEQHDVKETSYHILISRLDLHICDDSSDQVSGEYRPRFFGGAIQLTFRQLGLDYYPFHRPGDGSRHWERHCSAMEIREQWVNKTLQNFKWNAEGPTRYMGGTPLGARESPSKQPSRSHDGESTQTFFPSDSVPPWKRLRCSCMVLRVDDLDIHQVSTGGRHSKKTRALVSCDRKSLQLPDNVPAIYVQFTEYYLPDYPQFPVPSSNLYAQLNGLQLCMDSMSILWINLFTLGLLRSLEQIKAFYNLQDTGKGDDHVDIRLDVSQLKLLIPLESTYLNHPDRPLHLSIHTSQAVLTNTRHSAHGTQADLQGTCHIFARNPFFQPKEKPEFPQAKDNFDPLPSAFFHHAFEGNMLSDLSSNTKLLRSQDVWSLSLSRLALDFEGARRGLKGKPQPFLEPFAMSIWICCPAAFENVPCPNSFIPASSCSAYKGSRLQSSTSYDNYLGARLFPEKVGTGFKSRTVHNLASMDSVSSPTSLEMNGERSEYEMEEPKQKNMASIHVLVQALSPVKMKLNHYQYVALLRMKDSLSRLTEELAQDTQGLTNRQADPPTVCVGVLLDTADVILFLPPSTSEAEEERSVAGTESPSLTDSDLSPTKEPTGSVTLEDSGISTIRIATEKVEEACEAVEALEEPTSSFLLKPSLTPQDESSFSLEGELASALTVTLDLTKEAVSVTKDAFSILSKDKMTATMHKMLFQPYTREQTTRVDESPGTPGKSRVLTMKHSPSQHSFESTSLDGSLPDEHLSVDSDNSDNFVILMDSESGLESMPLLDSTPSLQADTLSRASPALGTEGGSQPDLSSTPSQSTEDMSQEMVSVLLLQLRNVSCAVDIKGDDLSLALEAQDVIPEQLGNMKVQQLLSGETLGLVSPQRPVSAAPCHPSMLALRFEVGPAAVRHSPLAESNGFLHVKLRECTTELLTSTLNNLGPFLEDELVADVLPMRIDLADTSVTLKDDGPRVYPTSPKPIPVTFCVDQLTLERCEDGVFYLKAPEAQKPILTEPEVDLLTSHSRWSTVQKPGALTSISPSEASVSEALRLELAISQKALSQAIADKEKLLQEIRKYNPRFHL